ncbi:hypothetical protein RhiirA1_59875 [Rhizophagus irregularis]|uniref:Uncharacterized protein n=1 Tax=Rhizophagus irregularis TaxID=588596 RepID=A0A2N0S806_9GLOM|nr:hypothetical protein RhiirA1_59875 [Rhizophagus irregularis]
MGGMESFMYRRDNELIDVAEAFARKRDGIDDTTKVFLIKLRQLIFTTLENRGFNNININYNQNFLHEFIKKYQSILNNEIDRYHKLKDFEKNKKLKIWLMTLFEKLSLYFGFDSKFKNQSLNILGLIIEI